MPQSNLIVHISDVNDPYFNLALEDHLFQNLKPNEQLLYLWRNSPTVVIGRSQNPWVECHLQKMADDNVQLARRQSGGGAVYQDFGNTNFTFLASRSDYDQSMNLRILQKALQMFDIEAYPKGRNDLVVNYQGEVRKISGSAFRQTRQASFHHGTLLIRVDLDKLGAYLNPNQKKLASKGVRSVRSRVLNLETVEPTLNHERICQALMSAFEEAHQASSIQKRWTREALANDAVFSDNYALLRSWEWRFGRTMAFTHRLENRFDWGTVDFRFQVDQGRIQQTQVFSDCLYPELIEWVEKHLSEIHYAPKAIDETLQRGCEQLGEFYQQLQELKHWITAEVEGL